MTDDKANTLREQEEQIEVGIQTDAVSVLPCPGCGVEIDTEGIPSFTEIACPHCKTRQTVPARLGNFRLLDIIGSGGMGAVFMAQDDTLNRRVAIKVMLRSIGSDPKVLETFRREAQSAARLNNPHIVQIYSFGEEKGQPYLVMELVSGDKLDEMIESGDPLDHAFVIRVGLEIAEGLATAQAANLVHGDIKPENILFDERLRAKLVDFGIASMLSSKDAGKEIWGTPYYIAPEKAQRKKSDIRSDIYSLGATLYHAIAGKPPFEGEDPVKVIRARFEAPAVPLTEARPGTDPQVSAIIERMMQNDLFLRYPNYNSLMKDMRKYLDTVPEARKAGPQGRKIRLRKTASQSSSGLIGPGVTSSSGELRTGSGSFPASPGSAGKKSFVIQKGTLAAAASAMPSAGRLSSTGSVGAIEGEILAEQDGEDPKPRRRLMSPKTLAMVILSLFGIGLLAAIAVVAGVILNNQARERELDQKFVQAQAWDKEWADSGPVLADAVSSLAARDAEARSLLDTVGETIQRALSMEWNLPDLEPPEPVAPLVEEAEEEPEEDGKETPEETGSPENGTTDGTPSEEPAEEPAEEVDEEAVEEVDDPVMPRFEPDPEPADPLPPLIARAEALLLDPARKIRANLRKSEALRDREDPPLANVRREAMTEEVWSGRKRRIDRRMSELAQVREWIVECDEQLREMRRMVPELDRMASRLIAEARRREEAERLAREADAAEAAARRAQAERDAKVRAEVSYIESLVMQRRALIERYDYERVSRELERVREDLVTEGGLAALDAAVARYARLASLREFILRDLREHEGLRWGLGRVDIVDADEEGIVAVTGQKIRVEELTIPQWLHLIVQLLETRPAERRIRVIEHGEQLFNAALFCIVHGGGSETAHAKAVTLAQMALQRRTALRPDVARLIPEIAGPEFE